MKRFLCVFFAMLLVFSLTGCSELDDYSNTDYDAVCSDTYLDTGGLDCQEIAIFDDITVPAWDGENAYIAVNDNQPYFDDFEKSRTDPFENYADLDELGRCGVAYANICQELMPTEKRGEIGSVKPSGWHTVRYNGVVSGNYLYNRCHLIGYQLAGENANTKNLITGTRYLNIDGMLGFENQVADYVKETGHHVLYRVTPVFLDSELVSRGVLMEGWSVEDSGYGICFNVFAYNTQPGVVIDYMTGDSWLSDDVGNAVNITKPGNASSGNSNSGGYLFAVNTNSGKFHLDTCEYVENMNPDNRDDVLSTVDGMISSGYSPCGKCHPDAISNR